MKAESAKQANNISPIMRTALENVYLDWLNNYASIDTYAEHNQLTYKQAFDLITIAKDVYNMKTIIEFGYPQSALENTQGCNV